MNKPAFFRDNILTLEMIVAEINDSDKETAEWLAGYYAFDAASDCVSIEEMSSDDMDANFDFLIEAGAEFDRAAAMVEAEQFKAEALSDA